MARAEVEKPAIESPLLDIPHRSFAFSGDNDAIILRRALLSETRKQLWLAGPLIASSLLQYILQVVSVMFVGHLGELALSGASMATSFAGVTGFSFMLGMSSALDTLCGQSFGAKQYYMLGVHMQKAMVVLTVVCVPLSFIWASTGPILKALGQDPEISDEAGVYAKWMIPAIFAYGLLQCEVRFLQTQNIVFPMMISSGFAALLHILVCWVLVFKSGLGKQGAALSISISYWINAAILSVYIGFSPACKKTWRGFSKEAIRDLMNFVRLAVPSAFMVCLEFWSFEMLVLLSGLLPNPEMETSALSICLNIASLMFMLPFGLSAAISTRVSNELGAGQPRAALLAVRVVVFLAITEGLVVGSVMTLASRIWGYAYSNEQDVRDYVSLMMPILAISSFFDGIQCVLTGIARGCGWQKTVAFVNLGAYYIVGIPCAVLLAFVFHIGGKGLWIGIICGVLAQCASLLIITLCTSWEEQARKAILRVQSSDITIGS